MFFKNLIHRVSSGYALLLNPALRAVKIIAAIIAVGKNPIENPGTSTPASHNAAASMTKEIIINSVYVLFLKKFFTTGTINALISPSTTATTRIATQPLNAISKNGINDKSHKIRALITQLINVFAMYYILLSLEHVNIRPLCTSAYYQRAPVTKTL